MKSDEYIELASKIVRYFTSNRGVGHSELVLRGARNGGNRALVVVKDAEEELSILRKCINATGISLKKIQDGFIDHGVTLPLVFDNQALMLLLNGCIDNYNKLESEYKLLEVSRLKSYGMAERLLTTTQAAKFLSMTSSYLSNARMRGDGPPFIKLGKKVKYRLRDIEAWIDENTYGKYK